jgi:hypothetical protein
MLDEIRLRAVLLCRLEPAILPSDAEQQAADRVLKRRGWGQQGGDCSKGNAREWRSMMSVWKAVRRIRGLMSAMHAEDGFNADRDAARAACMSAIIQFLRQRETSAAQVEWAIQSRVPTAQHRHVGLLALLDLIKRDDTSIIPCIAVATAKCLVGWHVLDGIHGAGADVVEHVRAAHNNIVLEVATRIASGADRHAESVQLLVSLLSVPWSVGDFLHWKVDNITEVLFALVRELSPSLSRSLMSMSPPRSRSRDVSQHPAHATPGASPSPPRRARALGGRPLTPPGTAPAVVDAAAAPPAAAAGFFTPQRRRDAHGSPSVSPAVPRATQRMSPPPSGPETAAIAIAPGDVAVSSDGFTVRWTSGRGTVIGSHEWTQHVVTMPTDAASAASYYFEVTVVELSSNGSVAVGLGPKSYNLARPPGWDPRSCALHSDDGVLFVESSTGRIAASGFGVGSTVGCGVNPVTHEVFWTVDGRPTNARVPGFLYDCSPMIGMDLKGVVRVNFGEQPFVLHDLHAKALGVALKPRQLAVQARDALANLVVRLARSLSVGVATTTGVRGCTTRTLADIAAECDFLVEGLRAGKAVPIAPVNAHLVDCLLLGATVLNGISKKPADASASVLDCCAAFVRSALGALLLLSADAVRVAAWSAVAACVQLLPLPRVNAMLEHAVQATCVKGAPASVLDLALAETALLLPCRESAESLFAVARDTSSMQPLTSPYAALSIISGALQLQRHDENAAEFSWATAAMESVSRLKSAELAPAVAVALLSCLGPSPPPVGPGTRVTLANVSWRQPTRLKPSRPYDRWIVTKADVPLGVIDLVSRVGDGPPLTLTASLSDVVVDLRHLEQQCVPYELLREIAAGVVARIPLEPERATRFYEAPMILRTLRCLLAAFTRDPEQTLATIVGAGFLPLIQHHALLHALPTDFDAAIFAEQESFLVARLLSVEPTQWPSVDEHSQPPSSPTRPLRLVERPEASADTSEARHRMAQELSMRGYALEMCAIALEETHYNRTGALRLLSQHHDDMLRYLDESSGDAYDEEDEEEGEDEEGAAADDLDEEEGDGDEEEQEGGGDDELDAEEAAESAEDDDDDDDHNEEEADEEEGDESTGLDSSHDGHSSMCDAELRHFERGNSDDDDGAAVANLRDSPAARAPVAPTSPLRQSSREEGGPSGTSKRLQGRGAVFDSGLIRVTCRRAHPGAAAVGPYFTIDVSVKLAATTSNQVIVCHGHKLHYHMALGIFEQHVCFGISRGAHPLAWCAVSLPPSVSQPNPDWLRITCSNTSTELHLAIADGGACSAPMVNAATLLTHDRSSQWSIGAHHDGTTNLRGAIRDLRIWSCGTAHVDRAGRSLDLPADQLFLHCRFDEGAPPIRNSAPAFVEVSTEFEIVGRLSWLPAVRTGDAPSRFIPAVEVDLNSQLDSEATLFPLAAVPEPFDRSAAWRSVKECAADQLAYSITETTSHLCTYYSQRLAEHVLMYRDVTGRPLRRGRRPRPPRSSCAA